MYIGSIYLQIFTCIFYLKKTALIVNSESSAYVKSPWFFARKELRGQCYNIISLRKSLLNQAYCVQSREGNEVTYTSQPHLTPDASISAH